MKLDLRKEFAEIYSYLVDRVHRFDPEKNDGPGDGGPVSFIEVGFEYDQAAWVVVVFDTRPDMEPDGEWNSHIEGQALQRPTWLEAGEAIYERPVTLIQLDGSEQALEVGTELAEPLGELLKSVLLRARSEGVFARLPKTRDCEIGVEHQNGVYSWPAYDDRKKENLA